MWWLAQSSQVLFSAEATGGTTVSALALFDQTEVPTTGIVAVAPQEDVTVLRMQAALRVTISGVGAWTLSVATVSGGSGDEFGEVADQRILWSHSYDTTLLTAAGFADANWSSPGTLYINATADQLLEADPGTSRLDIKVNHRMGAGGAPNGGLLWLVTEESGAATITVTTLWTRWLCRRSAERR